MVITYLEWDIPIYLFAYVLFCWPPKGAARDPTKIQPVEQG